MPHVTIGAGCILGQNVLVASGVTIGNNVKIQNNVSVYDAVTLEDDVFCGPSMVFTNVHNPRSAVERKHEYRRTLVRRGDDNRSARVRTPITDGAYGEPWVFRQKDIASWWSQAHHPRTAGVRSGKAGK